MNHDVLDKILDQLMALNITVARQEENIKEHIRRTEAAETNIDQIANSIRPIQEHVAMVKGGVKLLAAIGGVVGLVLSVLSFFKP